MDLRIREPFPELKSVRCEELHGPDRRCVNSFKFCVQCFEDRDILSLVVGLKFIVLMTVRGLLTYF